MRLLNACLIAFATYSRIPVPQAKWTEENMRYSFCFFPLIGVCIGAVIGTADWLCGVLGLEGVFFAALAAVVPTLLTGGIHMDGFCDTCDGLASCQPMEKKLEILKDSNAGAFAVIRTCVFYLLYFAAFTRLSRGALWAVCCGFVLSRACSGWAVVNFRGAKNSGLAAAFRSAAHRRTVTWVMVLWAAAAGAGMLWLSPVAGGCALLAAAGVMVYYRVMCYRQFGGLTGDLAGYFLCLCELCMALAAVLGEGVWKLWS